MVNFDKNVQGAKLEARAKAWRERKFAKEEREALRHEERKERRAAAELRLLRSIAANLEAAESRAYAQAFEGFAEEGSAHALSPLLLQFVVGHTDLSGSVPRVARAVRVAAAGGSEDTLGFDAFLQLLRDHAASESTCRESFAEALRGRSSITLEEAKTYSVHVALKLIDTEFEKEKWDGLATAVFGSSDDADEESLVDEERYLEGCKRLARCARILELEEAKLSECGDQVAGVPAASQGGQGPDVERWRHFAQDVERWWRHLDGLAEGVAGTSASASSARPRAVRRTHVRERTVLSSASHCSLCLACGGLCSHHGGPSTVRSSTAPTPSSAAPATRSSVPSVPMGPVADGCTSTASSRFSVGPRPRRSRAHSPGRGRRPGLRCDLCKACGGLCAFHAKPDVAAGGPKAEVLGSAVADLSQDSEVRPVTEESPTVLDVSGHAGLVDSSDVCKAVHDIDKGSPLQDVLALQELYRDSLADAIETENAKALEDAIVLAASCGISEHELLPVFQVLEDFWAAAS